MDNSDPDPALRDLNDFFFDGAGLSFLLIHGLTGTPYEMRYLGQRLAAEGFRVHGVRLAGHAGAPEELGATTHLNWYESVVEGLERLRGYPAPIIVVGLSMGALLATRLAAEQPDAVAGLVMLAPAFYLPSRRRWPLRLMQYAAGIANRIYFHQPGGSDIHDATARRVHPGNRLMPLSAALNLLELSDYVRPKLAEIEQPALIIHSRNDHTYPFEQNTRFAMNHLASAPKRLVVLADSYHVITVDTDKDRVAQELLDFADDFRAAPIRRVG